jgi:hypothetical protein
MSDVLADLKRWSAQIAAMPEPISYIVLDHGLTGHEEGRDGKGRRYIRVSPAILGEVRYVRVSEQPLNLQESIFGVPVFRRQDMAEGWPHDHGGPHG